VRRHTAAAAIIVAAAGLAAPAGAAPITRNPANARHTVMVGSKNFTEQYVLGQIYAQSLRAAGYRVRTRLGFGTERKAFRALRRGAIGAYPEYTGVILTSLYGVPLAHVPHGGDAAWRRARQRLARDGVRALPHAPANDTLTMVLKKERADALGGPRRISDLKGRSGRLTVAGYHGCNTDPICLKGVRRRYGLRFRRFRTAKNPYDALGSGRADIAFAFTTDPDLTTGRFVPLADDRGLFPSFHVTLLFRKKVLAHLGPDARRVMSQVQKPLTTAVLRDLDARVALGKKSPKRVASEFLREHGFVQ
jgi:glycine betaine/choline ABC-type transport system substrate-binding protein